MPSPAPVPADPPFRSIVIVGLGLIGGSVALSIRERWPAMRVSGVDTPAVLAHALGSGAIDRAVASLETPGDADLVLLAAPVQQIIELLPTIAARQPMIVTDVGGTKRTIVDAARALPADLTFVGGHPLGGGERGGFAFARPDLFAGRPWILTPDGHRSGDAATRLSALVSGLGARPTIMTPDAHDQLMAYVSHLPQLTASALMATVGNRAGAEGLLASGKGLLDTTRLASSPADVWRDVCATNADAIGLALDDLIALLTDVRAGLQRGEIVDTLFADAARWRGELLKGVE
jgi:prephenate dehydrogenase